MVENFERTLEALARAGVSVRRERVGVLDEILEMNATYGTLTAAEAYNEYREIVDSDKVEDDRPPRRQAHHGRQEDGGKRRAVDPARAGCG